MLAVEETRWRLINWNLGEIYESMVEMGGSSTVVPWTQPPDASGFPNPMLSRSLD